MVEREGAATDAFPGFVSLEKCSQSTRDLTFTLPAKPLPQLEQIQAIHSFIHPFTCHALWVQGQRQKPLLRGSSGAGGVSTLDDTGSPEWVELDPSRS